MKFDIDKVKRQMLIKYPAFGSITANVSFKEDTGISTACTDGKIIYYNPNFLENLSAEEQQFVLAHEVCHIAFNHILRSKDKNPKLWNIATDAVINQFLQRDGLTIVEGGIDIAEAIKYDAEEYYEILLSQTEEEQNAASQRTVKGQTSNEQQTSQSNQQGASGQGENDDARQSESQKGTEQQNGQGGNSKDGETEDVGHDTHSMWKDAVKQHEEEQQESSEKSSNGSQQESSENSSNGSQQAKQEECEAMGEKKAFDENAQERKRELERIKKEIISEGVQMAGKKPGGIVREVHNVGISKPIVDWRYFLREATTRYDIDWSFQNAEVEYGVITPKLEEFPIPETEIVIDTSGSINEELLRNFLRECKNILHHSALKVGCFDTKFYGFHEIRRLEDIENMPFEGGGGTNFDAAVGAFSRRVQNKIIFTDGEAPMPTERVDAIWVVFGRRKINPKGGKVIYISPEELRRLCSYEMDQPKGKTR